MQVFQKVWSLTYEEEEGVDPPQNVSPKNMILLWETMKDSFLLISQLIPS